MSRVHARTGLLLAMCFFVIFITPPYVAAVSTQWFPTSGTSIDYAISQQYMLLDGSIQVTDTYSIYSGPAVYYLVSSYIASQFPYSLWSSYTLLENASKVNLRHAYNSAGGSLLNQTTSLIAGNRILNEEDFSVYLVEWQKEGFGWSAYTSHMKTGSATISLNSFWSSVSYNFPDHFNRSALIGDNILSNFGFSSAGCALTSMSEKLTALTNISTPGVGRYLTLTADLDGKVQSFILDETSSNLRAVGFQNASVRYTLQSGIPGFSPIFLLVGAMGAVALILIHKRRKFWISS